VIQNPETSSDIDQDRLFAELCKDSRFLNYRMAILAWTVIAGLSMFVAVWFMFKKVATLLDVITIMVVYIAVTVFLTRQLNRMKAAAQERLKREDEETARRAQWGTSQTTVDQ
jgi:hypothetical protein